MTFVRVRALVSGGLTIAVMGLILVCNVRLYTPPHPIAHLDGLRDQLETGAARDMQASFPEGYLFTYALYGLAWVQLAITDPTLRDRATREARWALSHLETSEGRAPFSPAMAPPYGVFYNGWTNWLRGGIVLLDPMDEALQATFKRDCEALAKAFRDQLDHNGHPFLPAYPGQAWPVDSMVGLAVLRLHDRQLTPRYDHLIERWVASAQTHLDPSTGLLPHRVDPHTGSALEGARGSSQTVLLRFMADASPSWINGTAKEPGQYTRFRSHFVQVVGGLPGVREYPHGTDGTGDVDSGPLVLGVSASATVVGMGTATIQRDTELANAWLHAGEAIGLSLPRLRGGRTYALGQLPVGDAFVLWSQTATPWTSPPAPTTPYPPIVGPWRLLVHGLSLLIFAPLGLRWRRRRRHQHK